jgi:hypothetical protein
MRSQAKEIEQIGDILDQTPRKCGTQRLENTFEYHTPPSNRKGRVLATEEISHLQQELRHVRSMELAKDAPDSGKSCRRQRLSRKNSFIKRGESALGFREAEVKDDIELAGLTLGAEASFQRRLESARSRQYRFGKMGKKRSGELWKDVGGWLGFAGPGSGSSGGKEDQENGAENENGKDEWI